MQFEVQVATQLETLWLLTRVPIGFGLSCGQASTVQEAGEVVGDDILVEVLPGEEGTLL